jgi:hypothetical protein
MLAASASPAGFERPLRGLPIPALQPRVSLANNARFTLGFIRAARVAGFGRNISVFIGDSAYDQMWYAANAPT